ncbi:MAG: NRDE family protein [Candidatus Bathyarchaeota archaeon]|nr:NRDE family protein [Candidatus Bathyarchaeota archaeon]
MHPSQAMCTLIMLYKLLEDFPIIALHNRYLGKDTKEKPPQRVNGNTFCPIDVASQGTWFGFNDAGLLVGITNQETQRLETPGRSRGLLALDLLKDYETATEATKYLLDDMIRSSYRTGNFILMDKEKAWHIVWDRGTHILPITPGAYTVSTVTEVPGIEWSERARAIHRDAEKRRRRARILLDGYQPEGIDDALGKMMEASCDHEYGKSQASICWHSEEFMQTSSSLIAMASNPLDSRMFYCEGNACENRFKDYSSIIGS